MKIIDFIKIEIFIIVQAHEIKLISGVARIIGRMPSFSVAFCWKEIFKLKFPLNYIHLYAKITPLILF